MVELLAGLMSDESGQGMAEYALIITLVAVVLAGLVGVIGVRAGDLLGRAIDAME
ncbi:MAG: Flp family type IVb pilin [Firmicutes bacterium]|nr:Flp family type IVb pilin [Bacillota bacterium]MDH7495163.1 Flp family type IVb pilin [Bacillota bacterium]